MVPWVFLYGISAMLFNHPEAFADTAIIHFSAAETQATALGSIPPAGALAEQVVKTLNARAKDSPYRLVEPAEAAFARDLNVTARGDGQEYLIRLNLADGSGTIRPVEKKASKPAPFASKAGAKIDPLPFEPASRGFPELLGKLGLPATTDVNVRTVPDLTFLMGGPGNETWKVAYNAVTGQVSGRPADTTGVGPSVRRELLQMHLAHGYPSQINARWVWAICVDLMFVSMVGWGATGLAMWWQMKNVRRIGAIVLIASVVTATLVAIGMHATFIAESV